MSRSRIAAAALAAGLLSAAEGQLPSEAQVAYCFGYMQGERLAAQLRQVGLDPAEALKGLAAAIDGKPSALPVHEVMEKADAVIEAARPRVEAAHRAANEKMLTSAAARPGAKRTESGLIYEVLKEGTGAKPKADATVSVHYVGTLADGTEFDSSRKRGQPIEFSLNGVIRGWTEGLQLMPQGATYRFTIPSDLAYGAEPPQGAPIPPNAVLVFEVELLGIK